MNAPSFITVFKHYRIWCKNGDWETTFSQNVKDNKEKIDLSLSHIDGSHTPAYRGGEKVEYQSGNHTDFFEINDRIDEIVAQLSASGIDVDGLFSNLDACFDGDTLRIALDSHGIISNVCPNRRNGADSIEPYLFDEEMYKERWIVERTDAWMDGFKAVLTRFDTTISSWKGWNFLAFLVIFLKKFHNSQK